MNFNNDYNILNRLYKTRKKNKQFYMLITLFISSMILLTSSPNIISIILGWDGLGLSSFCLVIYFQNKRTLNSGILTVITNRLGDCFIICALSLIFNDINFEPNREEIKIQYIMLITGAFTKRAQIPFSSWLPAAIAAPTPVSALVHSSTLVTAGIYLMTRFNVIFSTKRVKFITITSAITTSVVAGIVASKEIDRKKIVAISTLSQLGVIAFNLSLNIWKLCLIHISIHAIFKALLFIATGFNIRISWGRQEKRSIFIKKKKH